MKTDEIKNIFTYHSPSVDQIPKYQQLRDKGCELALLINSLCPGSREQSLALTKVQEAVQMANAAIAIHADKVLGDDGVSWVDKPAQPEPLRINVNHCQRCDGDHAGMPFYPMARPVDEWTYYGFCHTTQQPVLLKITVTPDDASARCKIDIEAPRLDI